MSISAHFSVTTAVMLVAGGIAALALTASIAMKSSSRPGPQRERELASSSAAPSSRPQAPPSSEADLEYLLDMSEPTATPSSH